MTLRQPNIERIVVFWICLERVSRIDPRELRRFVPRCSAFTGVKFCC